MSRNKKKLLVVLAFIFLLVLCFVLIWGNLMSQYTKQKQQKEALQQQLLNEEDVELQEQLMKAQAEKAKLLVSDIKAQEVISLLKVQGSIEVSNDKTPDNNPWTDWLINSQISVNVQYTSYFSLDVKNVDFSIQKSSITVQYKKEDIFISAVNVDKLIPSEKRSILGKQYTPDETSALILLATQKVKDSSEASDDLKSKASEQFQAIMNDFAEKFDVKLPIKFEVE